MKNTFLNAFLVATLIGLGFAGSSAGQEPTGQKTLAATVGVYVFPEEGQDSATQSKDEAACYKWAADTTKSDPFDLVKRAEQQQAQADSAHQNVAQTAQGAGAVGAVKGAAPGALV